MELKIGKKELKKNGVVVVVWLNEAVISTSQGFAAANKILSKHNFK